MLTRLGGLNAVLTALTGVTALYFALVVFGNVTDFGTNHEFVRHVTAMDTTFGDPDVTWRAITDPALVLAVYLCVIVWEAATAVVLIAATGVWLAVLAGRSTADRARRWSSLGWTMAVLLFGGGFIVIGGEWFQMWQSEDWNGLQAALQNFLVAGVGLILVHLPGPPAARPGGRVGPEDEAGRSGATEPS